MSERACFNVVDDPWIPALRGDAIAEVSLREALREAHGLRGIVCEVPTQVPPILRLLLAVLYRALRGPQDLEGWLDLWGQPELPCDKIDAYLDDWRDRFDLFHPVRPFLQCPAQADERTASAAVLVAHLPTRNNVPLFVPRLESDPPTLSPAEALRWLLHTLAWDTAGIKTGRPGDPAAKKGKSYDNPVGPLGDIGVVLPLAGTLRETLLLNLVPLADFDVDDPTCDRPAWEGEEVTAAWRERPPSGPADLYTWLSRRVTLVPERLGGRWVVRKAIVGAGDCIAPGTRSRVEPHTAWRVAQKGSAPPEHEPVRHDPAKEAWRGLGSLLATNRTRPLVLKWIGRLRDEGACSLPGLVEIALFAITYGARHAVVEDAYWDQLPLPVLALSQSGERLAQFAVDCAGDAEQVGKALSELVLTVMQASGYTSGEPRSRRARNGHAWHVAAELFHTLDTWFRRLLEALKTADADIAELRRSWQRTVHDNALGIGDDFLAALPPAALARRSDAAKKRASVWEAELRWRKKLREALPLATQAADVLEEVN